METEDQEELTKFLLHIDCLKQLDKWDKSFNIFDVLKIKRTEIRHSNILAWLLDPNENHNLGDSFIKKIIQEIISTSKSSFEDVVHYSTMNYYNFSVYREREHIDVLLVSEDEKTVIAIENKIDAGETGDQLITYSDWLDKNYKESNGYRRILLYLTPDGKAPSNKNWKVFTYESILKNLEEVRKNATLESGVALLIDNYIEILRRDIVEDKELKRICNEIYQAHYKALNLIFENKTDFQSDFADKIRGLLGEMSDVGITPNIGPQDNGKSMIRFNTKKMTEILPDLISKKASWNNEHCYAYEIGLKHNNETKKITGALIFTLSKINVPDETFNRMNMLAKEAYKMEELSKSSSFTREGYQCVKKISLGIEFDETSDFDNDIKPQLCNKINEMLDWEDKLIKKLEQSY